MGGSTAALAHDNSASWVDFLNRKDGYRQVLLRGGKNSSMHRTSCMYIPDARKQDATRRAPASDRRSGPFPGQPAHSYMLARETWSLCNPLRVCGVGRWWGRNSDAVPSRKKSADGETRPGQANAGRCSFRESWTPISMNGLCTKPELGFGNAREG